MSRNKEGSGVRQEQSTMKAEEKEIFEDGEKRQLRDQRFKGTLAYSVAEVVSDCENLETEWWLVCLFLGL